MTHYNRHETHHPVSCTGKFQYNPCKLPTQWCQVHVRSGQQVLRSCWKVSKPSAQQRPTSMQSSSLVSVAKGLSLCTWPHVECMGAHRAWGQTEALHIGRGTLNAGHTTDQTPLTRSCTTYGTLSLRVRSLLFSIPFPSVLSLSQFEGHLLMLSLLCSSLLHTRTQIHSGFNQTSEIIKCPHNIIPIS